MWVGPAQLTGPESAQQEFGRSRPRMDWADLGPTKSPIFFWAGPGPDSRDGLESVWPTNTWLGQNQSGPEKKNPTMLGQNQPGPATEHQGGNYFPPPLLHAERCSFCMHAGKRTTKMQTIRGRKVTWCGGGGALLSGLLHWCCCGGGRWRCRGSRTAAPSGVAAVSNGRERDFFLFPSPLVFSLVSNLYNLTLN